MNDPLPPPPIDLIDGASLYLDFDGTLVEIAETPDAVVVEARVPALLSALSVRLDGRLALISGRAIDGLAALVQVPGLAISGSHGVETLWGDGRRDGPARSAGLDVAVDAVRAFAAARDGVLVEEKPFGVALHYRGDPAAADDAHALVMALAGDAGLDVQTGKMVVELRPAGVHKGHALRRLHAEAPFAGHRPLFVGDDDTDEAAFVAAAGLGGCGILVGPPRATAARYRLDDVTAVRRWLGDMR
ncbi:trehalose-phosphatase [Sphingomonas montana]|uniref:trehalose-phosphatase n=1 Tax=Sphingomonas montana TaxID=1843236 RepID=UPI00096DFBD8|nr:trehalose-phosphatase [Sphingomonas montana]